MVRRRELVLLGYYGAGNLGDDLMLRGLLTELLALDRNLIINVVSYYDKALPFIESSRVRIIRAKTTATKLVQLFPLFSRCSFALFGGGTPFTDTEGDGSYKFFRLAHLLGCRFGYLGVGIGQLENKIRRRRAAWLIRHSDLLVFRDPESANRARDLLNCENDSHIHLGEDLCYLYVDAHPVVRRVQESPVSPKHLVISWRYLTFAEAGIRPNELMQSFVNGLRELAQQVGFVSITLLPLDLTADIETHQQLSSNIEHLLPDVGVTTVVSESLEKRLAIIQNADLFISVRLHGAFMGKSIGVPTIGISYSPKVRYYFNSISSKSLLDWQDLLQDNSCLVRAAEIASNEASLPIDMSSRISLARQGVRRLVQKIDYAS